MRRSTITFLIISLCCTTWGIAETIIVSGDVSGTWSADTVLVEGEIRVPPEMTLVIEPGVEVLFQGHYKFIVDQDAILLAVGTDQDSILFTATVPDTGWHGIRFLGASDSCRMEYCHITYGKATGQNEDQSGGGIYVSYTELTLKNCRIDHCSADLYGGGICGVDSSSIEMHQCYISNCYAHSGGGVSAYNLTNLNMLNCYLIGNEVNQCGGGIECLITPGLVTDNVIKDNSSDHGGGIYIVGEPSPVIKGNLISLNSAHQGGGGLKINNSDAEITKNIILENISDGLYIEDGGGIFLNEANVELDRNIIYRNSTIGSGGGIFVGWSSSPYIHDCIIADNYAIWKGGGLWSIFSSHPTLKRNIIIRNRAMAVGGGLGCRPNSYPNSIRNLISANYSSDGGGIHSEEDLTYNIENNTICGNITPGGAGGILSHTGEPILISCILWANIYYQIGVFGYPIPQVIYSDIQDTLWPGHGNIDEDPLFIDPALNDYRLQWGSPCIDTGDPDPQYNDPDGTRADMGAFYYDQSMPIRILLTPHEIPYLLEETGGAMDFTVRVTNIDTAYQTAIAWCDATMPDSTIVGPLFGPVTLNVPPSVTFDGIRTQTIPGRAPFGVYHYNVYAVVGADTSKDSFMFGKLGTTEGGYEGWSNYGEPLGEGGFITYHSSVPTAFALHQNYPNPFNSYTTIRFDLPEASRVKLELFDIAGRLVGAQRVYPSGAAPIITGWRDAGHHEVTFDASGLPSGLYIYRLEAGEYRDSGKMILLK